MLPPSLKAMAGQAGAASGMTVLEKESRSQGKNFQFKEADRFN